MENKDTETTSTSSEHAGTVTTSCVKEVDSGHTEATSTKDSLANDGSNTNHDDSTAKTSDEASLSNPNPLQSSGTTTVAAKPASYVLPVKRFSAVNINKKFLEKTSSTSTSSSISHNVHASSSAKQNGAIARPTPQSAPSHSRLVTTKLTATSSSSATGASWSRPSSVTPPVPANSASSTGSGAANASASSQNSAQTSATAAPQVRVGLRQKSDGRPAWGSVAQSAPKEIMNTTNDFPTAAEAAQGRKPKASSQKVAEVATAHEQVMHDAADADADAFRGVHLDPNAHHWDEMDEDDNDDYLGEVIDFGDGRQYTIQVNDSNASEAKQGGGDGSPQPDRDGKSAASTPSNVPVSKAERFADDFDRSWPRARHGQPGSSYHSDEAFRNRSTRSEASSTVSGSPVSTRDANQSRVLFNERSNRMELYDGANRPTAPGTSQYRRSGGETWGHTTLRHERDLPPHGNRPQLQLLQKSQRPGDYERGSANRGSYGPRDRRDADYVETGSTFSKSSDGRRSRGYSNARSTVSNASSHEQRPHSRERSQTRDNINGHIPTHAMSETRSQYGARRDSMHSTSGFSERQLPPHMHRSPQAPPVPLKPSSEDSEGRVDSSTTHMPLAQVPAVTVSATDEAPAQPTPVKDLAASTDLEDLRKAFLHERAEQAKWRRQQEEEERAKAQERARKKALEIEAKLAAKAAPPKPESHPGPTPEEPRIDHRPTESQVLSVIEEAIMPTDSVAVDASNEENRDSLSRDQPQPPNAWGQRMLERTVSGRNVAVNPHGRQSLPTPVTEAERAESWRKPRPALPVAEPGKVQESTTAIGPPKATLAHASPVEQDLNVKPGESVEVVDFSDLGKLADPGSLDTPTQERHESHAPSFRPRRPTASDFFDDARELRSDIGTSSPKKLSNDPARNSPSGDSLKVTPPKLDQQIEPSSLPSPSFSLTQNGAPASPGRMARPPPFREAPMSALDDTMSRIKGVLDGMQSSTSPVGSKSESKEPPLGQIDGGIRTPPVRQAALPPQPPPQARRWIPPALRPPTVPELFDVTRLNLPQQELDIVVRLPTHSRKVEPLSKRQYNFTRTPPGPVRWDILSFDPPVEGMNRRTLSVNDVLIGKPPLPGRRFRYRVWLPKPKRGIRPASQLDPSVQSRPIPPGAAAQLAKPNSVGAFGRPSMADTTSWRTTTRKPCTETPLRESQPEEHELNVTSRSPPPEPTVKSDETTVKVTASASAHELAAISRKVKGPVGMPEGADVAFSRNLIVDRESSKGSIKVNFTVTSELDDTSEGVAELPSVTSTSTNTSAKSEVDAVPSREARDVKSNSLSIAKPDPSAAERNIFASSPKESSLLLEGTDGRIAPTANALKGKEESRTITPPVPTSSSIWGKSPSRAPDREHLKAVWSQASDRDTVPTVNSLKEIADDLPAVPFSIHEAKLDDDGIPPPIAPPARMSASDVTRAFQTVPAGPSGSKSLVSHPFSPPLNHMQTLSPPGPKPVTSGIAPSTMANGSRPLYMGYPSMQSHTPSPTMMYPQLPQHVMQNQIRGSPSSPYGQPVWMPVQTHPAQHSPQLMRAQPASPYGAPVLQYQPATQTSLYPPNSTHHSPQPAPIPYTNGSHQPQRMSLISPILPAASPVHPPVPPHYSPSPMLYHVPPPGGVPQSQPYLGAVGMGRGSVPGQPPVDNRQPGPPMAPPMAYTGHTPAYSHVPPHSFVRPSW